LEDSVDFFNLELKIHLHHKQYPSHMTNPLSPPLPEHDSVSALIKQANTPSNLQTCSSQISEVQRKETRYRPATAHLKQAPF
jgi:hypothetical protein